MRTLKPSYFWYRIKMFKKNLLENTHDKYILWVMLNEGHWISAVNLSGMHNSEQVRAECHMQPGPLSIHSHQVTLVLLTGSWSLSFRVNLADEGDRWMTHCLSTVISCYSHFSLLYFVITQQAILISVHFGFIYIVPNHSSHLNFTGSKNAH